MAKLTVRAGQNGPVFMEGYSRRDLDGDGNDIHVIRDTPVEVEDTRFYRRRIAMGDLVLCGEE